MILRKSGRAPQQTSYPAIDVLRAELDAFADAIETKNPFPVPEAEVLATLSAFEAALQSMASGNPVACDDQQAARKSKFAATPQTGSEE
jgi:predicted dehydrogenase